MKFIFLAALLAAAAPAHSQDGPRLDQRVTKVEKRVTGVEKRVTRLESGAVQATAAALENPIAAVFVKKRQVVSQDKMGLKLYVEFENVSNRRLFAFNGTLVFKDEAGALLWSRAYAYSEPIGPGEKAEAALAVSSEHAKVYLKLMKARGITVSFEKQESYGVE